MSAPTKEPGVEHQLVTNLAYRPPSSQQWIYLERGDHPWRKQLYIRGRNLTARQLVGGVIANGFTDEEAASNYHLPVEAIQEARYYVEQNVKLLEIEATIERLMVEAGGFAREPLVVS
jgi:uncharacterized protein (DUF433 family)